MHASSHSKQNFKNKHGGLTNVQFSCQHTVHSAKGQINISAKKKNHSKKVGSRSMRDDDSSSEEKMPREAFKN